MTQQQQDGGKRFIYNRFADDPDSTHAKIVRLVGRDKRVLELGTATGYMSRVLKEQGCTVVGVEIDPDAAELARPFCERVIVGDLDLLDLDRELGDDRFDVVVAADVLEHTKDPARVLRLVKSHLRAGGGYMAVSLPNVAHGSVRLALLTGVFPYGDWGLLDRTHLRFFTRHSIGELFASAGYDIAHAERQFRAIENCTEIPYDRSLIPPPLLQALSNDADAMTFQYILTAVPKPPAAGG
jgi:2-polyprenyl-3-methyl-5-hydroxy-6-metoxy-1,4-benzoquinol methylase